MTDRDNSDTVFTAHTLFTVTANQFSRKTTFSYAVFNLLRKLCGIVLVNTFDQPFKYNAFGVSGIFSIADISLTPLYFNIFL